MQSTPKEPLVIVTACDDNYAIGVAAAMRSAIGHVPSDRTVRLFVLDGGITDASKRRLLKSWQAPNVEVAWLLPDLSALRDMHVSGHISISTYLRILLAELLPADIDKAIYLDADTIACRDLVELWSTPLDDAPCAAAHDYFHPFLNPAEALSHPIHCRTLKLNPEPIPNYRELGLDGKSPYFNAGIMLVNVAHWRRERVAARAFECLRTHREHVRYWDQYALNTLFSGQWRILDPRWNQNSHIHRVPSWNLTHFTQEQFQSVVEDPWIIHFDYKPKPWDVESVHPFRRDFFRWLDQTDWRGWRPRRTTREQVALAYGAVSGKVRTAYKSWRTWRRTVLSPAIRPIKHAVLRRKSKAA